MKKVLMTLVVGIISFVGINNVSAKILTVDEVIEEYRNTSIAKLLESDMVINKDETNKQIVLKIDKSEFRYNYGDDYIEYVFDKAGDKEDLAIESLASAIPFSGIMESIINLSGYKSMTIDIESITETITYEEYGLEYLAESFSVKAESGSSEGDILRKLKISLDTEKIDKLMKKYGKKIDDEYLEEIEDELENIEIEYIPTLKLKEVKENIVTLVLTLKDAYNSEEKWCTVYRSESENGKFSKLSNDKIKCNIPVEIKDETVEANKTYYYRAVVEGDNLSSELLKVTTPAKQATVKNPKTGIVFPTLTIISLGLISVLMLLSLRKKDLLNK